MKNLSLPSLALLPPDQLTARLYSLRAQERGLLVEFLAYLGELDNRKLYLELGFPSTQALLASRQRAAGTVASAAMGACVNELELMPLI